MKRSGASGRTRAPGTVRLFSIEDNLWWPRSGACLSSTRQHRQSCLACLLENGMAGASTRKPAWVT